MDIQKIVNEIVDDILGEDTTRTSKKGAPGTFKSKITKAYGGPVTIEKAKKFKDRPSATAHDKAQANWFINMHSAKENLEPAETSGKAAPYGSGYKTVQEVLQPYMESLTSYMIENGLGVTQAPVVHFVEDEENAKNVLGVTGYYNPTQMSITLFTTGRHPKDVLRSFAHEMIHYCQDCEDRLHRTYTTNINEDDRLKELEREAYERGNMYFRGWENKYKN